MEKKQSLTVPVKMVPFLKSPKYLFTLDHPFMAKDGKMYRSIWGSYDIIEIKDFMGFRPTQMTNFVYLIGRETLVAGCQVKFVQSCPIRPKTGFLKKIVGLFLIDYRIYLA